MSGSMNKVLLVGRLGREPEIRSMNSGERVANLSLATSESWKDNASGEKHERTEWHRVVMFGSGLVDVCERYLQKGSQILIEGRLQTRKWQDQSGQERYTTEIVVSGYSGRMVMLGGRGGSDRDYGEQPYGGGDMPQEPYGGGSSYQQNREATKSVDDFDDDIPF